MFPTFCAAHLLPSCPPPPLKTPEAYRQFTPPPHQGSTPKYLAPLNAPGRHTTQHRRQCRCTISPRRLEKSSPYRIPCRTGTANGCSCCLESVWVAWVNAWVFSLFPLFVLSWIRLDTWATSAKRPSSIHRNHPPCSFEPRVCPTYAPYNAWSYHAVVSYR